MRVKEEVVLLGWGRSRSEQENHQDTFHLLWIIYNFNSSCFLRIYSSKLPMYRTGKRQVGWLFFVVNFQRFCVY